MKTNRKGGFTLIELLVVIAIIGILSSIVLVSLNSARKKGSDTRVISDVNQTRTQLESDYNGGNYSADLTSTGKIAVSSLSGNLKTLATDATSMSSTLYVVATGTPVVGYAAYAQLLSSTNYFCIDNAGIATTTPTDPSTLAAAKLGTCGE